jgi:hypothetical protein
MTNAQSRPERVTREAQNHDNIMINKQDMGTTVNTQHVPLKPTVT